MSVRHAQARLTSAVQDGGLSEEEAEGFLERLRAGEHPEGLRARLAKLRPRSAHEPDRSAGHHRGAGMSASLEDLYASPPPWDIGRPQPAFVALADAGAIRGRVLDVGCGTGEHALMAAGLGLDATGVDLAPSALRTAKQKAHDRGRTVRFLLQDARRLADLGERFDTVVDCGLFHVFTGDDRTLFVESLEAVTAPGGRYFMLCVNDRQSASGRMHEVTGADIHASFALTWRVDSLEPATIEVTTERDGVPAWLVALTRL